MAEPVRIAVVMACFNRRATTLRCLQSLFAQAGGGVEVAVHLLDDASPDGTGAAVREAFPQVNVIDGDGQRFWGGGMFLAMQAAIRTDYDFMLWLNDDVDLRPDALAITLEAHRSAVARGPGPHVIIGAVTEPGSGEISYSGFRRRNAWHPVQLDRIPPEPGVLTACDTMNGNFVLVPADVVRRIGIIEPYPQQLGDIDYGYRATRADVRLWIAPTPVGACERGVRPKRWRDGRLTLSQRMRVLNSPHGLPLKPWLRFMWRFGGALGAALFAASYAKEAWSGAFRTSPGAKA